jgi:DNA-binding MarR family transcriptional regulator
MLTLNQNRSAVLFDLFLAFNRRLLSITRRLSPPLTLSESHILGEILQQKIINSSLLIKNLHIEKTKVSRIIASFTEKEWITSQPSVTDKRVRYFTVTNEGARVFFNDNQYRNQQVQECLIPLTQGQRKDLAQFLNGMADKLQASPISPVANEPLCKIEIRRLTRALGYLGDNLMNSGMPADECQVLHLVHRDGDCISMGSLKEFLPYEMTMISRLTSDLEHRNFLRKNPLPYDKRHVQVLLTNAGSDRAEKNLTQGGEKLLSSIANLSKASQDQFTSLLKRFLIEGVEPYVEEHSRKFVVSKIKTEEARQQARSFLIKTLAQQQLDHELRETLLHPDNICYQLSVFGETRAVCEISTINHHGQLVYFVSALSTTDLSWARELLLISAKEILEDRAIKQIHLSFQNQTPLGIQNLFNNGKTSLTRSDIIHL